MSRSSKVVAHDKYLLKIRWDGLKIEQFTPHHILVGEDGQAKQSYFKRGEMITRAGDWKTIIKTVVQKWATSLEVYQRMNYVNKLPVNALKELMNNCPNTILFGDDSVEDEVTLYVFLSSPNDDRIPLENAAIFDEFVKKVANVRSMEMWLYPVLHTRSCIKCQMDHYKFMGARGGGDLTLIGLLSKGTFNGAYINHTGSVVFSLLNRKKPDPTATISIGADDAAEAKEKEEETLEWEDLPGGLYMEMDSRLTGAEALIAMGSEPERAGEANKDVLHEMDELDANGKRKKLPTIEEEVPNRLVAISDTVSETSTLSAVVNWLTKAETKEPPLPPPVHSDKAWRKRMMLLLLDQDDDEYIIIKRKHVCRICRDDAI